MAGFPGSDLKCNVTQTKVDVTNNSASETEHAFQKGTKAFTLICNDFDILRISWASSEVDDASNGDWFLLYPRESYSEEDLHLTNPARSLWMNAPDASANVDVVVIEWA